MMRQVQIVNLHGSSVYNPSPTYYPSGISGGYITSSSSPYVAHSMQAASMKACADDIIKFYDDNDDLISVFKMMPGMVVQFL